MQQMELMWMAAAVVVVVAVLAVVALWGSWRQSPQDSTTRRVAA